MFRYNISTKKSINWDSSENCHRLIKPLFYNNTIDFTDIIQGEIGSCWFLCSLINYLRPNDKNIETRKKDLMKSIRVEKRLPDRTIYSVYLHKFYIHVDDYIPENYYLNHPHKSIWFILYEKAMISLLNKIQKNRGAVLDKNKLYVDNLDVSCGEMKSASVGIFFLTGRKSKHYCLHPCDIKSDLPYITSIQIYNKFKAGDHFLANTYKNTYPGKKYTSLTNVSSHGVSRSHCYSIINMKYCTEKKTYLLTIVNPWGRREISESANNFVYPEKFSKNQGVSIITWERFVYLFACVHMCE